MSPRLADVPKRAAPPVAPSPKHPFDRDPLLIPQLFVDAKPPWYRQPVMLVGIVVTNAIVFVDRVQQMKKRGHNTVDALLEAGETRLRPILMTAFATIFALLPLALGYGEGAAMSQGLAIVVIGGLASSTLLTLFIVPIVYLFLSQLKERWQSKRSRQAEA